MAVRVVLYVKIQFPFLNLRPRADVQARVKVGEGRGHVSEEGSVLRGGGGGKDVAKEFGEELLIVRAAECGRAVLGAVARIDDQCAVVEVCVQLELGEPEDGLSPQEVITGAGPPAFVTGEGIVIVHVSHHPGGADRVVGPLCVVLHSRVAEDVHLIVGDVGGFRGAVEKLSGQFTTRDPCVGHIVPERGL